MAKLDQIVRFLKKLCEAGQFEKFLAILALSEPPDFARFHEIVQSRVVRKMLMRQRTFRIVRLRGVGQFKKLVTCFYDVQLCEAGQFKKLREARPFESSAKSDSWKSSLHETGQRTFPTVWLRGALWSRAVRKVLCIIGTFRTTRLRMTKSDQIIRSLKNLDNSKNWTM